MWFNCIAMAMGASQNFLMVTTPVRGHGSDKVLVTSIHTWLGNHGNKSFDMHVLIHY